MITITISYNNVEAAIRRATEYEGQKNGAYNALRAIKEDEAHLKWWYREGVTAVCILLDRVLARNVPNAVTGDYDLTLNVSNDNVHQLQEKIEEVVESHVLYKWFRQMNVDKGMQYRSDAQERLEELKRMVYYRKMPR